jgi:hypothetical protein
LQTVRVTAKPELGFYPKRCEERQIPTRRNSSPNFRSTPDGRPASSYFRHLLEIGSSTCSIGVRR